MCGIQGRRGTGAGGGQATFFQKSTLTPIVSATERREATQPVSAQPARSAQSVLSNKVRQWRVSPSLQFCPRARPRQRESREGNRDFPLRSFSSMSQDRRSQSELRVRATGARQHPFQNHVILQALYTHSSHNGIIDLAGASCWGFRNARSVQETDSAGQLLRSRALLLPCAELNKLTQIASIPPPSESVCRTQAESAQRFDSSKSKGFYFNASLRVGALAANLNYCEFCTPKRDSRENLSKICSEKLFH
jgi:hypothetical protein